MLDAIGLVVLERNIFNFFIEVLLFRYFLPFEKGEALHLTKRKFPLPNDTLY